MTAVVRPVLGSAAFQAATSFDAAGEARLAPYGPAQQQAPYVYDDFDRADGTIRGMVTPTGQTWGTTGTGYLTAAIVNRRLSSADNVYASLAYGAPVNRISGTFSVSHGIGADIRTTTALALHATRDGGLLNMLHLQITGVSWTLDKYVDGSITAAILVGTYDLINDVPYNIAMEISGNTVTVYPPQGVPVSITDADVSTIAAACGTWQIIPTTDALLGRWWRVSMGPDQQGRAAAAIGAAPAAEVGWLHGAALTRRQRVATTLTGGAGWYRIAITDVGFMGGAICGFLSISASDQYTNNSARVVVEGGYGGAGTLVEQLNHNYTANTIDKVRLSYDGPAYAVALDVHVPNAYGGSVLVTFDFEGYFTVVSQPVVGATVLATGNVVLSL
jgi:hypothetical protein